MSNFNVEQVAAALANVEEQLGLKFYEEQATAITKFTTGHDVFVSLPTSYGKSLIFQSIPLVFDFLRERYGQASSDISKSIALVISPLISLTEDQVVRTEALGLKAVNLSSVQDESTVWEDIIAGKYSVVYSSPETILSDKGTKLLSSPCYTNNLCGIFIDEGHCIAQWGFSSDHTKAFRDEYSRLCELRAMVPSSIHLCVLTATATEQVKKLLCENLALTYTAFIEQSPNRKNVRYAHINVRSNNPADSFGWLVDHLKEKGQEAERMIIFCQTRNQCDELYGHFEACLGDRKTNPLQRPYAMFHAWTPQKNKDDIIKAFGEENGRVRVLFATVAFGMGIDAKGVHTIIHFGTSKTVLDYLQETGRAGRDGKESLAVLIDYPKSIACRKPEPEMKEYVRNKSECRRNCLLKHFKESSPDAEYTCCDICTPTSTSWVEEACINIGVKTSSHEIEIRQLLPEDSTHVRAALFDYQQELMQQLPVGSSGIRSLTGDLSLGMTHQLVERLVDSCQDIVTLEEFSKRHPFFDAAQANHVYSIIEEQLKDCCIIHEMYPSREEDSSSASSSTSSSSDEYQEIEFVGSDSELYGSD